MIESMIFSLHFNFSRFMSARKTFSDYTSENKKNQLCIFLELKKNDTITFKMWE